MRPANALHKRNARLGPRLHVSATTDHDGRPVPVTVKGRIRLGRSILTGRMKQQRETVNAEDVLVSSTDELVDTGDAIYDRNRRFGEYKATNAPLSAAEVQKRRGKDWLPRTTENITDLEAEPEKSMVKG